VYYATDLLSRYMYTTYTYDTLGNLIQVRDDADNLTTITYDMLGRKTSMVDPDMGTWYYYYDNNGNLIAQVDARNQATNLYYDALNRLKGKTYTTGVASPAAYSRPADPGSGHYALEYTYDSTAGGNYGLGLRTGLSDASGSTTYIYDARGRLAQEIRTISDSGTYTTAFTYDNLDRITSVTYPGGEVVTTLYNDRGLPVDLSGSVSGDLVDSVEYNAFAQMTSLDLHNGIQTTYGYYGLGGTYDTAGGYYGRLWEIKSTQTSTSTLLQDVQHSWDADGNLTQRYDAVAVSTENFTYDYLDRLTSVSGDYFETYSYDTIGNITSKNGVTYSYGIQPHAVTQVGPESYTYDANGNMLTGDGRTITWTVENKPSTITVDTTVTAFTYDGDGNRIIKSITDGTTVTTTYYVNSYLEKTVVTENGNPTFNEDKFSYYLGSKLIAVRTVEGENRTLSYIHQDSLGSSSLTTTVSGTLESSIAYFPFGSTRNTTGTLPTDQLFTGQRLDDNTGLYYYNARYYDPEIGRFISPDAIIPDWKNPQAWNKYSYVFNNPLKYTDNSGHILDTILDVGFVVWDIIELVRTPSWENAGYLGADLVCAFIPFATGGGLAVKGVMHGDDILKSVKAFIKNIDIVKEAAKIGIKNPYSFRGKLQLLTGKSDQMVKGLEAHHVLPKTLEDQFKSRFGNEFDINNPIWGAWVKKGEHQKWSHQYQKEWDDWLTKHPRATIEEVMDFAQKLGNDPKYNFKVIWAE